MFSVTEALTLAEPETSIVGAGIEVDLAARVGELVLRGRAGTGEIPIAGVDRERRARREQGHGVGGARCTANPCTLICEGSANWVPTTRSVLVQFRAEFP